MRRIVLAVAAAMLLIGLPAAAATFPDRIDLPDGFAPEGITIGEGGTFYTGSLLDGSIYRGSVRTGEGSVLVTPPEGRVAVGMKVHRGLLFVAGGETGDAYVYDASTGAEVRVYSFVETGFINDVVVTRNAAWFTDSINPALYKVPLDRDGVPANPSDVEVVPLTGEIVFGPDFPNVNGIEATPDGSTLIIVQSNTGKLFTVDPQTGITSEIDLGADNVNFGDGLLLDRFNLYVVQNFLNAVAKVSLSPDLSSGVVVSQTTDPGFDIPTTVAEFRNRLYLVNARFNIPPGPDVPYWITKIGKP
jgi:sugar lactone lactonase YvrE